MKLNIRGKLIAHTASAIALVGASIAVSNLYFGRQRIVATVEDGARREAQLISELVVDDIYGLDVHALRLKLLAANSRPDVHKIYVTDPEGVVLSEGTETDASRRTRLEHPFAEKTFRSTGWITRVEEKFLEIGGPILTADGRRAGYLFVQFSLAEPLSILSAAGKGDLWVAAVWLVVGVIYAVIVSGSFTRPVAALAEANKQIAAGRLDTRIHIARDDELGLLAESTNEMAEALQTSLAEERRLRDELLRFNQTLEQTVAERTAELKAANEELRNAKRVEADFVAMIVHDLRSPLHLVVSTAAMLEDGLIGPVTEEQKSWLAKIQTNCHKLAGLVDSFLDLSKIEGGHINLEVKTFDLNGLIEGVVATYLPLAREKTISLAARWDPGSTEMEADSRRIEQLLSNLLSNAIKFTPAGGAIEVGSRREANPGVYVIWVKDSGDGIAPQEMGGLFRKYTQATAGRRSKDAGTGLGLLICRMIAEAQRGSIHAESEPGKGSTFTVRIPVKPNSQPAATEQEPRAIPRKSD